MSEILTLKKQRVDVAKKDFAFDDGLIKKKTSDYLLRKALSSPGINIIAEIKRASPSKGIINGSVDVEKLAIEYKNCGACAISVLTEEDKFLGSIVDLKKVREVVDLPILRKDFIFDDFQVYESKQAGADAILLIVAMLDKARLKELYQLADSLGMDVLVEVHTFEEMMIAVEIEAKIIGINNRNLRSFEVSLDVSKNLIRHAPKEVLMVSESGISRKEEILELRSMGFSGFLIGEALMKSENLKESLRSFCEAEG